MLALVTGALVHEGRREVPELEVEGVHVGEALVQRGLLRGARGREEPGCEAWGGRFVTEGKNQRWKGGCPSQGRR